MHGPRLAQAMRLGCKRPLMGAFAICGNANFARRKPGLPSLEEKSTPMDFFQEKIAFCPQLRRLKWVHFIKQEPRLNTLVRRNWGASLWKVVMLAFPEPRPPTGKTQSRTRPAVLTPLPRIGLW
jgi:hypothetical protein